MPMESQNNDKTRLLVNLEDVNFTRDGRKILCDVNFAIKKGDFIAITGPNGGGKTTLLRLILGLIRPDSGKISFYKNGQEIERPHYSGYLPQKHSIDSHFPITVKEVIASGLLSSREFPKYEREDKIEKILELIGLTNFAGRTLGSLSGGQVQRTLLGRALVSEPNFLVMDEPTNYLDSSFEDKLYRIMEDLAANTTVLIVSHQMTHVSAIARRHIVVDRTVNEVLF